MLEWKDLPASDFKIELHNDSADRVVIGYEAAERRFFIDRSSSGRVDFAKGFAGRQFAPRLSANARIDLRLFIDAASVELFADGGSTVMTSVFFPRAPFDRITLAGFKNRILIVPIGSWQRP
jgi:fructan beta-fructosidase